MSHLKLKFHNIVDFTVLARLFWEMSWRNPAEVGFDLGEQIDIGYLEKLVLA